MYTVLDQRMERIISLGLLNLRKAVVNGWKTGEMDGGDEAAPKSYVAFAKRRREVSRAIGWGMSSFRGGDKGNTHEITRGATRWIAPRAWSSLQA